MREQQRVSLQYGAEPGIIEREIQRHNQGAVATHSYRCEMDVIHYLSLMIMMMHKGQVPMDTICH